MFDLYRSDRGRIAQRLGLSAMAFAALTTFDAQAGEMPDVTIGAGMRSSFVSTDVDGASEDVNDFSLNSIRLYVNGSVTDEIKFMFNTEYQGDPPAGENDIQVLDAAAIFAFSDQFNIWAGRFLPPSDRANMYGPYYANNWNVFTDGVQDGYPFTAVGRDNGVMYWGQFGIMKLSAGAFDVPSTVGDNDILAAARVQFDFWDPEAGYYLNGTYYGEKDLFAIGFAGQTADGGDAYSADLLVEKKLPNGGVATLESEYTSYDELGGYDPNYLQSDGYYGLLSYLFPAQVGIGKIQVLGKYGEATFEDGTGPDYDQDTLELNLNYIIQTFNARLSLFYKDTTFDAVGTDFSQIGVGVQLQI